MRVDAQETLNPQEALEEQNACKAHQALSCNTAYHSECRVIAPIAVFVM